MKLQHLVLGAALVAAPSTAMAQDAAPQATQAAVGSAEVAQCMQAQAIVKPSLDSARAQLEIARQTNSPAAMRAAVDALDAVLRDVRTQLEPCGQMSASAAGPTAGHVMPSSSLEPGVAPAGQNIATMPRHNMATVPAPATQQPAAAGQRAAPAAPKQAAASAGQKAANMPGHNVATTTEPASADLHAGHAMTTAANPAAKLGDLTCQPAVDPKTAPRATYLGKAYYFCSVADRDLFLKAPAKALQRQ